MTSRIASVAWKSFVLGSLAMALLSPRLAIADDLRVFWASDPVKPGQTVQITGAGLKDVKAIDVTRLGDRPTGEQAEAPVSVEASEKSDNTLSFILPASLKDGVYSIALKSGDASTKIQLNAPDLYWLQGDRGPAASAGGWLRLSGRNIATNGNAVARLTASNGQQIDIKVSAPDTWSASFAVPQSLVAGTYQVRLWNGSGDSSTWRDVGRIAIEAAAKTERPVMELLAVTLDRPTNDDTARINASLQALSKRGGGTLLLRPGIYRLTDTLTIPDGVDLKGEATDLVTLIWKDTETPPDSLIQGVRDFSVEDLTIYAQRHLNIVKGGLDPKSGETVGSNITVRKVVIRASSFTGHLDPEKIRERFEPMARQRRDGVVGLLLGGSNIRVEDCDVLSSMRPIVITKATGAYVARNTFHEGRRGWYGISAPDGVIFEDNRIIGADLQASGGGINTFDGPFARNVLIRNNRFETILGWDREAMTTDGPGGYYRGAIEAVSGNTVRIMDPNGLGTQKDRDWRGAGVFVLQGKGVGAIAHVLKRTDDTLELDRNISSIIDSSSIVTITPMQEKFLVIGNSFTDTGQAQVFGTGYKHVFAENRTVRSNGITATSLNYKQLQPIFYIQILNNSLVSPPLLRESQINVTGRQYEGNTTVMTLGVVIRGNRLLSGSSIRIDGRSEQYPAVLNVLVEQNEVNFTDVGISIGPGVENLTLRDNTSANTRVPVKRDRPQ